MVLLFLAGVIANQCLAASLALCTLMWKPQASGSSIDRRMAGTGYTTARLNSGVVSVP